MIIKIINVAVDLVVILLLEFNLVMLLLCICHPISNICMCSIVLESLTVKQMLKKSERDNLEKFRKDFQTSPSFRLLHIGPTRKLGDE